MTKKESEQKIKEKLNRTKKLKICKLLPFFSRVVVSVGAMGASESINF